MLGKIVDEGLKYLRDKGYDVAEVRITFNYYDELGSPDPVIEFYVDPSGEDVMDVWRGLIDHLRDAFDSYIKHYVVCVVERRW